MRQRDHSIDLLRVAGGLAIMLAHANPPAWLFQLRNFGTPMLIVVAALSAAVVYRDRPLRAWPFLKRRLFKLTVPPWLFLSFFFGTVWLFARATGKSFPFSMRDVVTSYTFHSGIGYVWVFKVYIIIAMLLPTMMWFRAKVQNKTMYFALLLLAYVLYEWLNEITQSVVHDPSELFLIDDTVIVVLPYAILFAYGLQLEELADWQVLSVGAASLFVFGAMAWAKFHQVGHFIPTQKSKYPPTLYYLSYALAWVNLLYLAARSRRAQQLPSHAVAWLSSNMLWIYLWHIMGLFVWDWVLRPVLGWPQPDWPSKLVFVVLFGIGVTALQQRLAARLLPARWKKQQHPARIVLG